MQEEKEVTTSKLEEATAMEMVSNTTEPMPNQIIDEYQFEIVRDSTTEVLPKTKLVTTSEKVLEEAPVMDTNGSRLCRSNRKHQRDRDLS